MAVEIKGTGASTFPEATLTTPLAVASGGTGLATAKVVVQSVRTDDGALNTGTTVFPNDDTIPQITEGNEFITVSITPTSATNKLIIESCVNFSSSSDSTVHGALFQDSTANALTVKTLRGSSGVMDGLTINYEMVAGTTSSTTFRIRVGGESAGTITFNGASGARKFGGVVNSYIKVTEVTP